MALLLLSSLGLLFVFEGILPFLSPDSWRKFMLQLAQQSDRSLRIMGLVSMLIGLGLVCIGHTFF